jgi:uncharacterized MnhB-related membrane protein
MGVVLIAGIVIPWASASSPVTIGQTGWASDFNCLSSWSVVPNGVATYAVPPGTWSVTSWSTVSGPRGGSMGLMIFRSAATGSYTVVGESPIETLATNTLNTFALDNPVAVQGGDLLGLYSDPNTACVNTAVTGTAGVINAFGPQPNVGATITPTFRILGHPPNISATLASPQVSQTVSFTSTAPTDPIVGGTYTPAATATSGLPVAITIDATSAAVCSIAAGVVTFNTPGNCVIDADQEGNGFYAAADQVQQTMAVGVIECISLGGTIPAGYAFTELINKGGCGPVNGDGYNALRLNTVADGIVICIKYRFGLGGTYFGNATFPGYAFTELINQGGCGPHNGDGYNALRLNTVADGIVVCIKYSVLGGTYFGNATFPGYAFTELINQGGCGPDNGDGYNALRLNTVVDGIVVCIKHRVLGGTYSGNATFPGYAFTELINQGGCGPDNGDGYNALRLNTVVEGIVVCHSYAVTSSTSVVMLVPDGYVVTALLNTSACGRIVNGEGYNALRLNTAVEGIVACPSYAVSRSTSTVPRIPDGYVVTALLTSSACGRIVNGEGYNALRLNTATDGIVACIRYAISGSTSVLTLVPDGYVVTAQLNSSSCGPISKVGYNAQRLNNLFPTITSVTGATGQLGSGHVPITINFRDHDCDVTGGVWEGADGSGLSDDFGGPVVCSNGVGSVGYVRTCFFVGQWTEYVTLRDAAGNTSQRFPFTYTCA